MRCCPQGLGKTTRTGTRDCRCPDRGSNPPPAVQQPRCGLLRAAENWLLSLTAKRWRRALREATVAADRAAGCRPQATLMARQGLQCDCDCSLTGRDDDRLATLNQLTTPMCLRPLEKWSSESKLRRGEGVLRHDTVYFGNVWLCKSQRIYVESATITLTYHLVWGLGIVCGENYVALI